jgi:hypothetical protein
MCFVEMVQPCAQECLIQDEFAVARVATRVSPEDGVHGDGLETLVVVKSVFGVLWKTDLRGQTQSRFG